MLFVAQPFCLYIINVSDTFKLVQFADDTKILYENIQWLKMLKIQLTLKCLNVISGFA